MKHRINVRGVMIPNDYKWYYDWFGEDSTCPRDVQKVLDAMVEGDEIDWTTYDEATGTAKTMMGEDVIALKEGEYSYYKSYTYDDQGNVISEHKYVSEVHIEQFEMMGCTKGSLV